MVRPDEETPGQFGVWDGAVHGWRARHLPDQLTAAETAVELEIQYDAHGPRPADAIRSYDEPKRVRRAQWYEGELDTWIREGGVWYGRVREADGQVRLVSEKDLRLIVDES